MKPSTKYRILAVVVFGALSPLAMHAQSTVSTSQSSTTTANDPMTGQAQTTTKSDSHSMSANGAGDMSTQASHSDTSDTVNPDGTVTHHHDKHTKTTTRTPNGVQETEGTTTQTNTSTNPQ